MAFNLENMKDYAYPLVGAIYEVHSELGPGLNEYVYQEGLAMQLEEEGIPFEREKELTIKYHGKLMNATYRMDFLCAGAIVNSRIKKLYFGAYERKSGSVLSNYQILFKGGLNHTVEAEGGILEEDCSTLLKKFFKSKRNN